MYVQYDLGGGRSFTAISIPPPINPEIRSSPLSDVSGMHVHVSSRPDVLAYREAVLAATDEEVELARPQLYFVCKELKDRMTSNSFHAWKALGQATNARELLGDVLEGVSADIRSLAASSDRSPRNRNAHRRLAGAISFLAELEAVLSAVSAAGPEFAGLAGRAGEVLSDLGSRTDALRDGPGSSYAEVREELPALADAMAEAGRVLAAASFDVPRLTPGRLDRLMDDCGDRDVLWHIASGRKRQDFIDKGHYRPLSQAEATSLREGVASLLEDYDSVFNRGGFVSQLRQMAAALQHDGHCRIAWAESLTEGRIRNRRKSLYASEAEHALAIEEDVARIPADRAAQLGEARKLLASSAMVSSFLAMAGRAIRPGDGTPAFLGFTEVDGALVGTLDRQHPFVLAVYDDHFVRPRHPDAVYAARLPADVVAEGLPGLEEVRGNPDWRATNYRSVEECLGEIGNGTERSYFFDGVDVWGHDGFETLAARKAAREEQEAHAPGV